MISPSAPLILSGRPVADALAASLRQRVACLTQTGYLPQLTVLRAGDDPSALSYARRLARTAADVGVRVTTTTLPEVASEADIIAAVDQLAADAAVHGILIHTPLPRGVSLSAVAAHLPIEKDVDCQHPTNAGRLFASEPGPVPATAGAVMAIVHHYGIATAGQRAVVVGRSMIVGRPAALLLLAEHATVTICHSRTPNLADLTRQADLLIVAVGRAGMITPQMVGPQTAIIDAGINVVDGVVLGDVAVALTSTGCRAITPVPGGVGPVTSMIVLGQTVAAAERCAGA